MSAPAGSAGSRACAPRLRDRCSDACNPPARPPHSVSIMSEIKLLAAPGTGRRAAWLYALRTTNPPPGSTPDPVTRWLVVTRAAVLPMTVFAGLVAGLLAVRAPGFSWADFVLALVGITVAHTANNLMNDLADTQAGTDTAGYPRALYAPHPILSGL